MTAEEISNKLVEKGLKVTPQRMAILEAIQLLGNHPAAENISDYIRRNNPNISVATVYKVLDILVDNHLVKRVKTEKDVMRYDAVLESHHHIYCTDSDSIKDYFDNELDELLKTYFEKNKIPDFKIEDIKLQIIGRCSNR